jgi:hypothetical protein
MVLPTGFEPVFLTPEVSALSIELREPMHRWCPAYRQAGLSAELRAHIANLLNPV